jgi:signal transduction histidine kinase
MGEQLVNDFIYGILRDDFGNMWFSHNKGITNYNTTLNVFRHFTVEDGLQANEFNTGAYFKSSSGELFFGGINGTNSFHANEIKGNLEKPIVQITRIEVNDKILPSTNVSWSQNEIILDYFNNTVGFEMAGLEFTEPVKNQYAWRMIGIDRDWVQAGNRRFTRYANIPPGHYTFEVKASNNDGLWNETPTILKITITPPYWQTWWFRTLIVILFASLIGFAAFLISRQRYKSRIAELLVQQKIQSDRERISRDLHDNVGAMVSFVGTKIDWLLRHNEVSDETASNLKVIRESAVNTMAGLRETIWTLQDKAITNTDLADKLKVYAKSHLHMPCSITDNILHEQAMNNDVVLNVYRACQEIINNINKHSEATQVKINFSNHHALFEVEFIDNGIGFKDHGIDKSEHLGLTNIKQRLTNVGAEVQIHTRPGEGTKINITSPSAL